MGERVCSPSCSLLFVCALFGGARGRSFLCLWGVFLVAGFHVGVRGRAAGRVVRCSVKAGACRLTGAVGEPTPHFASVSEGERWLAERESAQRGGFTAAGTIASGSTGVVSGAVGDGRGIAWDDARACVGTVSAPNGTLVVGPSADSGVPARLVRGLVGAEPFGNMWRVPAGGRAFGDDVSVQGTVRGGGRA